MDNIETLQQKIHNSVTIRCNNHEEVKALKAYLDLANAKNEMEESLKCIICMQLSSTPVHVSACSKQVIGYSTCVQQWNIPNVNNTTCPHCQSDEYGTMSLQCFENVLDKLRIRDEN